MGEFPTSPVPAGLGIGATIRHVLSTIDGYFLSGYGEGGEVFLANTPGPIRRHYRELVKTLVEQAIVD
jgi:hypothetical protein